MVQNRLSKAPKCKTGYDITIIPIEMNTARVDVNNLELNKNRIMSMIVQKAIAILQ